MTTPDFPLSDESLLEHAAWVRKVARELVRDPGAADDLAQETWLAFLRARPDPERSLKPWFRTTLRNALSLRARRRSAQVWRETEVATPESLPSSEELVVKAEEQHRLARMVLDLDEPYRTALLLRYSEGLTPKQIAQAHGIPDSTVRSHIHRGLAQLRERLDTEHGGDRRAWVLVMQPWALRGKAASSVSLGSVSLGSVMLTAAAALFVLWLGFAWLGRGTESVEPGEVERIAGAAADLPDLALGLAQTAGERRVVPAATERVVTLVNARTGLPLAAFGVRVGDRVLSSAADGGLVLPVGTTSLIPFDHPGLATWSMPSHLIEVERPIPRDPVAVPADGTIALAVGPAFRLDMPGGVRRGERELRVTLVAEALDPRTVPRQVATVRAAEGVFERPWVRFASVPAGAGNDDVAWVLVVKDTAGLLLGEAELENVTTADAPLVRVNMLDTGAIEGTLIGLESEAFADVLVMLTAAGEARPQRVVMPDSSGHFSMRWIEPGMYTLELFAAGCAGWSKDVEVRAGVSIVENAALVAVAAAGRVSGVITSETGTYSGQLLVYLRNAEGETIGVFPTRWRAADGGAELTAGFEFEALPFGRLSIDVVSLSDLVTSRVEPLAIEAPCETVEITLRDRRRASDWYVDVRDSETGDPLESFEIQVRLEGGASVRFTREVGDDGQPRWLTISGGLQWNRFEGPTALRSVPNDATLRWTVKAEGFRAAEGDEKDFETDPGGRRAATVLLQRSHAR